MTNSPSGELFLVATPIGNLGDISARALATLQSASRIACEDTRVTGGLLHHFGIKKLLTPYHAHNEAAATETLIAALQNGEKIALVSDAGTPLLSDPGSRLVAAAVAAGIRVTPIPGASALLAGLTISGLDASRFFYGGFLPSKTSARAALLRHYAALPVTQIYYEAPHRLLDTLAALQEIQGDRPAAVARELTKHYEECRRGTLSSLVQHFTAAGVRGECVVMVAGAEPPAAMDDASLDDALRAAMTRLSLKEAVTEVARTADRPKREIYARALTLRTDDPS